MLYITLFLVRISILTMKLVQYSFYYRSDGMFVSSGINVLDHRYDDMVVRWRWACGTTHLGGIHTRTSRRDDLVIPPLTSTVTTFLVVIFFGLSVISGTT